MLRPGLIVAAAGVLGAAVIGLAPAAQAATGACTMSVVEGTTTATSLTLSVTVTDNGGCGVNMRVVSVDVLYGYDANGDIIVHPHGPYMINAFGVPVSATVPLAPGSNNIDVFYSDDKSNQAWWYGSVGGPYLPPILHPVIPSSPTSTRPVAATKTSSADSPTNVKAPPTPAEAPPPIPTQPVMLSEPSPESPHTETAAATTTRSDPPLVTTARSTTAHNGAWIVGASFGAVALIASLALSYALRRRRVRSE